MGRGKPQTDPQPKPGGRADCKVIIEFSSNESFDEERVQPVEGSGAPKRVMKWIHLTLPTSPAHVTTTETFTTFFINHGLTKALRKAFEKQGWSTDDMQTLITNFQRKHGKKVPLPKIYMDEDSSDSKGLELEDRTWVGRKAAGGSGGSSGGKPGRKPSAGGSGGSSGSSTGGSGDGGGPGPSSVGSGAGGSGGTGGGGPGRGSKCGRDDDDPDDEPNKRRKTGQPSKRPKPPLAKKKPQRPATYGGQYISPGVKRGVTYPPIDRNLAPLYISHKKERTKLGQ